MGELKIYMALTGTMIVGQEMRTESGKRFVKGASYLEMHASQARFNFSTIKFFEPSGELVLYESALLSEQEMPPMIAESFKLYLKQLEVEAAELKKQLDAKQTK